MCFVIPGYAIIKIIFSMLFEWYKEHSGLYEEDSEKIPDEIIEDTE
ncbi:MAG: hypothetical protein U5K84_03375 [Alkalibacterium sp.]|nr:hypothetical protein [Alkalibacterium sp.]